MTNQLGGNFGAVRFSDTRLLPTKCVNKHHRLEDRADTGRHRSAATEAVYLFDTLQVAFTIREGIAVGNPANQQSGLLLSGGNSGYFEPLTFDWRRDQSQKLRAQRSGLPRQK